MGPKRIVYQGESFHVQSSGRYYQSGRKDVPERLLHRRVWTDHHGPIPSGYEVHHVDNDWANNTINNLELKEGGEHKRQHIAERWLDPEQAKAMRAALAKGVAMAPEWHASPEGIEWHRAHGRKTWEDRESVTATCERCGKSYATFFPTRARSCSTACGQALRHAKRGDRTIPATCAYCGGAYMNSRHGPRKALYCSRRCGILQRLRPK